LLVVASIVALDCCCRWSEPFSLSNFSDKSVFSIRFTITLLVAPWSNTYTVYAHGRHRRGKRGIRRGRYFTLPNLTALLRLGHKDQALVFLLTTQPRYTVKVVARVIPIGIGDIGRRETFIRTGLITYARLPRHPVKQSALLSHRSEKRACCYRF
jgi:hypothetical protein